MDRAVQVWTAPSYCVYFRRGGGLGEIGGGVKMGERRTKHTTVGGVPVALAGEADLVRFMVEDSQALKKGALEAPLNIFDTNGQGISLFYTDEQYASTLRNADLIHADGQFIVWVSKLGAGGVVPERTATTDLIHAAAEAAQQNGISFFLLGGSEDINRRCAETLQQQYPDLKIAGRRNGYFSDQEEDDVIEEINRSGADVVWVGLGKPKEQIFCDRVKHRLNCAWLITCGGCFHFVAGDYSRAPEWMQSSGLEWLHRMVTRPKQLLVRYLVTIPHALGLVLIHDLFRLKSRRGNG